MYCRKCGKEIEESAKFCTSCGSPIQNDPKPLPVHHELVVKTKKKKSPWIKILFAVGILAICVGIFFFASNSDIKISDEQVATDILEWEFVDASFFTVEAVEQIETVMNDRKDMAELQVELTANNGQGRFTGKYTLYYLKGDEKWYINDVERNSFDTTLLKMMTTEQVESDLEYEYSELLEESDLIVTNISMNIPEYYEGIQEVRFTCDCEAENVNIIAKASVDVFYVADGINGWQLASSEITSQSYSAISEPDISVIDEQLGIPSSAEILIQNLNKAEDNLYYYELTFVDAGSYPGVTITWRHNIPITYDIENGWSFNPDDMTSIDEVNPDDIEINIVGYWQYNSDDEYLYVDIESASSTEVKYQLEAKLAETHIWMTEQTSELSTEGESKQRTWTYSYDEDNGYILFITDKPVFNIEWCGGLSEKDYYIEYRAYPVSSDGVSGIYIDRRCHIQNVG